MRRIRTLLFCCVALPLAAQQAITSATLAGTVEDSSGARLSSINVVARDQDRGQLHTAVTGVDGTFHFLRLQPGRYELMVEDSRFTPLHRTLTLSIGQALDLRLRLSVGARVESVNVVGTATPVESNRTQMSDTVSEALIAELPLNGRNYLDLALLVPGVSRTNTGAPQRYAETSAVPGTGVSVSGQRNLNNSFLVDGLSANDDAADLAGTFYTQETIREFQVVTSGANAEFGRASSGVVNIGTRSGTNDWHARLYGFLRNDRLDARNTLSTGKDPLTTVQYGATAGGRVVKDRTFVFSNFEQTRRHAAGVISIAPSNVQAINTRLDEIGYQGQRITTGEFPTTDSITDFFGRIDHELTPRNHLTGRYNLYEIDTVNARSVGGLNAVSRGTSLSDRDHSIALLDTATLSPSVVNESRFQFVHSRLGAPVNDPAGPSISISGVANLGTSTSSPTARNNDSYELANTFSMQRGKHLFKAGVQYLYNDLAIVFPGSAAAAAYSFSSLAAFQAGKYTTFQQAFGEIQQLQRNSNFGVFAQDEWKIRPSLTAQIGMRYDVQWLESPIQTDYNNIAPRVGIAWSPGNRRTVIRANYGLFYDRVPLRATSNALQRDGSKYRVALLSFGQSGAPVFPAQLAEFPAGQYINISTIDANIASSYAHQAGLQVEHQFGAGTLSVGYQWVRSLHLILSRNINVPTLTAAEAAAAGIPNLGRPNPLYGNIGRYEGSGDSYYNGLLVSFKTRVWKGGDVRVAYTLSKAIDDTGNFFFSQPQDASNLRDDRGLSDNDQRHRVSAAGLVALPGGFRLMPMLVYTSALPYNIQLNYDRNHDTNSNDRPVGVGRNAGRGFDFLSLDARLSRAFQIREHLRIEGLVEGFNILNRPNYALPNNVIGSGVGAPLPSFGRPTSAYDPRQIQLGLRVDF